MARARSTARDIITLPQHIPGYHGKINTISKSPSGSGSSSITCGPYDERLALSSSLGDHSQSTRHAKYIQPVSYFNQTSAAIRPGEGPKGPEVSMSSMFAIMCDMQRELSSLRSSYEAMRSMIAPTTTEILALRRLHNSQPKAFREVFSYFPTIRSKNIDFMCLLHTYLSLLMCLEVTISLCYCAGPSLPGGRDPKGNPEHTCRIEFFISRSSQD